MMDVMEGLYQVVQERKGEKRKGRILHLLSF